MSDLLIEDGEWSERAKKLAERSKDESLSVAERMSALYELGQIAETLLVAPELSPLPPAKDVPVYKFINGAKVRVK